MITVEVAFNQINRIYEADELWPTSYLMLHICRKLNLWPRKVSFHESDGTTLDKNKFVKDLANSSSDVSKKERSIKVIIKDLMTPDVKKNQEEYQKEMNSPISIDVSILPQGSRLQKWVRPEDTLASVVGSLMLEGCLSQIIDIRHENESLLGHCSLEDDGKIENGSSNDDEFKSNYPVGDLLLMTDCGLRDDDHLEIVFPQLEIGDDNESDMMSEDDNTSVHLDDKVNLVISSSNHQQPFHKQLQSSDNYLSILGDLLIDGFLNYRLVISRGDNEVILDTGEKLNGKDNQDKRDRSPLRDNGLGPIKGESLVKHFGIRDNDVLKLKFENLDLAKSKQSAREKEKMKSGVMKVDVLIDRSKSSVKSKISRIHVRPSDTLSTLVRYLRRNPRSEDVDCIRYRGREINQKGVLLKDDKRQLIRDIGLVEGCQIRVCMSTRERKKICIQCEVPDKNEIETFYVEHSGKPKGKEVIQFLTDKFKVKFKDLFVWQEVCYPRYKFDKGAYYKMKEQKDVKITGAFERVYYYEIESENNPSITEWRKLEPEIGGRESSHSEASTLDLSQQCWKRIVQVDGDYDIYYPKGTVPVIRAMIHVKQRRASSSGFHVTPIDPKSDVSDGLENSSCLGFQQAIMIQDKSRNNRSATYFFVRTREGFINPDTAEYVSKATFKDPKAFPIPVADREISFVLILLIDCAPAPKYVIPGNDNVCLYLREGNKTVVVDGTFANPTAKINSKLSVWLHPIPASYGSEKYYSDYLRTQFSLGNIVR